MKNGINSAKRTPHLYTYEPPFQKSWIPALAVDVTHLLTHMHACVWYFQLLERVKYMHFSTGCMSNALLNISLFKIAAYISCGET